MPRARLPKGGQPGSARHRSRRTPLRLFACGGALRVHIPWWALEGLSAGRAVAAAARSFAMVADAGTLDLELERDPAEPATSLADPAAGAWAFGMAGAAPR